MGKGRLLNTILPKLAQAEKTSPAVPYNSRKLVFPMVCQNMAFDLVVVRAQDVPVFVEHGTVDLGITGKDVVTESRHQNICEIADLGICRCRLVVASTKNYPSFEHWLADHQHLRTLRIATKYTVATQEFFLKHNLQVEIIKLYGSMELAPVLGLSDLMIDLVESGRTLADNGLTELTTVAKISARLLANKASLIVKQDACLPLAKRLEQSITPHR